MTTPCRSSTCDHLQCFDASLYLMMNEKKPKWVCPVCNKTGMNIFNHLLKIWKKSKIRPRSVQTKEKRSNTRKEILMLLSHKIKVTKVKILF